MNSTEEKKVDYRPRLLENKEFHKDDNDAKCKRWMSVRKGKGSKTRHRTLLKA